MFITAKVSVNLEVKISKQIGDDETIGEVRETVELEVDKVLEKVVESDKNIKVVSMASLLDAHLSG